MRAPETQPARSTANPPPRTGDRRSSIQVSVSRRQIFRRVMVSPSEPHSDCAVRPTIGRPVTGRSALPAGSPNAPPRELHAKRVAMDRENPSSLGQIPSHALEHSEHDLALELVRGLIEGEGFGRPDLRGLLGQQHVQRKIVELDDGPFGQDHTSLDYVLELAYVPRPPVRPQGGERFGR